MMLVDDVNIDGIGGLGGLGTIVSPSPSCLVSFHFVHLVTSPLLLPALCLVLVLCSCVSFCVLTSFHHAPASFPVHASTTKDPGPQCS